MKDEVLKDFIEKYNKDREELTRRLDMLDTKVDRVEGKFESFDKGMEKISGRLQQIEELQGMMLDGLGAFKGKLDNVKVSLSTLEDRLNTYKVLTMQGQKVHDGELYTLKIQLRRIRPIISWEGNKLLEDRYRDLEDSFARLEEHINR